MDLTWLRFGELLLLGLVAGGVGSLTGIGGGLIIAPASGAAASYVEQRLSDIRLGMTLELATTVGAVTGSLLAALLSREALAILFAVFMTYAGAVTARRGIKT